jgi:hypothetical protein
MDKPSQPLLSNFYNQPRKLQDYGNGNLGVGSGSQWDGTNNRWIGNDNAIVG